MSRRAALLLCAGAFAVLCFLLLRRLADFPGLHGDEAWVGVYARNILQRGFYSPHEMNAYTGPLYGGLLAASFRLLGEGVFALRLPGVVLNLLAAVLLAAHLWRREGPSSAGLWLLLLLGSPFFLLKARVAWEVYALQPLLLALVVVCARRVCDEDGGGAPSALCLLAASHAGVLNHFIFLAVPAALLLYAAVRVLLQRDGRASGLLALSAFGALQAGLVFAFKPRIDDVLWAAHRAAFCTAWLALPLLGTALHVGLRARRDRVARLLLHLAAEASSRSRASARGLVCAGFAAFVFFHWVALMQVLSGVSVFQRLTSWDPPLLLALPLYAASAAGLSVLSVRGLRALFSEEAAEDAFLPLLFLCLAAVFPIFRTHSTIRYYILPGFLALAALAALLPRLLEGRRLPLAALSMFLGCLSVLSFRETAMAGVRPPIRFHVGWRWEKSEDFLPKKTLYEDLSAQGYCRFYPDGFIGLPMMFYRGSEPDRACLRPETVRIEVCPGCARPYLRWEARP